MAKLDLDNVNDIPVIESHFIDTASAATIQAGICRWLLRNRLDQMSVGDIRGCGDGILKAKQARDAAVRALDLDAPPPSPWIDVPPANTQEAKQ